MIHDDEPLFDDYDPELRAFQQETGFDTYEEFYAWQRQQELEIDRTREEISVNPWEKIAIAMGIDRIAYRYFYSREHETPYYGEPTPNWWSGTLSLANKIGLHLINPYCYYEYVCGELGYEELIKHLGYEIDEYGLVWYTDAEKTNVKEITLDPVEDYTIKEPENILTPKQLASIYEILGQEEVILASLRHNDDNSITEH